MGYLGVGHSAVGATALSVGAKNLVQSEQGGIFILPVELLEHEEIPVHFCRINFSVKLNCVIVSHTIVLNQTSLMQSKPYTYSHNHQFQATQPNNAQAAMQLMQGGSAQQYPQANFESDTQMVQEAEKEAHLAELHQKFEKIREEIEKQPPDLNSFKQ